MCGGRVKLTNLAKAQPVETRTIRLGDIPAGDSNGCCSAYLPQNRAVQAVAVAMELICGKFNEFCSICLNSRCDETVD
jgi:hypothetical protein